MPLLTELNVRLGRLVMKIPLLKELVWEGLRSWGYTAPNGAYPRAWFLVR
jgi:hypothetical protein